MSFCTSCGNQVEDGSSFCVRCGARLAEPAAAGSIPPAPPHQQTAAAPPQASEAQPPPATPYQQTPPPQQAPPPQPPPYGQGGYGAGGPYPPAAPSKPRKRLPLWIKILIVVILVLAAAAAAGVFILGKLNDPQKTISAFVESVMAQDYEAFSKVTCAASEDLDLSEESVASFFALYSGRIATLEECQESLTADYERLKQGRTALGNGLVRLVEHSRFFILKTYEVEISGTEFTFRTNLDHTQITVGGQTIAAEQAEQDYRLLLLPGKYDITAACTSEVLGETFSTELKDCELTRSSESWYLNMEYSTVYLEETDFPLSSLTVNGRDYGPVEFSNGEFPIFPLPQDVEIQVSYDVDGLILRDSYTQSGGYIQDYFYPNPALDEETARAMLNQAGQAIRSLFYIYNSGDLASLQALDYGSSPILNYYINELAASQDPDVLNQIAYTYTLKGLTGNLDWIRESGSGLTYRTYISIDKDYYYTYYYEGELVEEIGPIPDNETMQIYLQWNHGAWVVSGLEWSSYYSVSDMSQPCTI